MPLRPRAHSSIRRLDVSIGENYSIHNKMRFPPATSYEPGNPIHGTVRNPHSLERNPGGSSSGEAALIASGASVLGIGSDIGGSIRIPSHLCGVCGFKPTSQRMRYSIAQCINKQEQQMNAPYNRGGSSSAPTGVGVGWGVTLKGGGL